jgi:DNA repair protein RadC
MNSPCPPLFELVPSAPIPFPEQPVARLMESGAEYLTDSELLSVVLDRRHPTQALDLARRLLAKAGSLKELATLPPTELARLPGIDRSRACTIHAALSLGLRAQRLHGRDRPRINTPADAAAVVAPVIAGRPQEEFHVLLLDTRNGLIRDETVTVGLVDRSQVHAREVFRTAIQANATRVLFVHNHPSGDPTPSSQDIDATKSLVAAGKVVGIEVLDHVVLGERTATRPTPWVSFREAGLLGVTDPA